MASISEESESSTTGGIPKAVFVVSDSELWMNPQNLSLPPL